MRKRKFWGLITRSTVPFSKNGENFTTKVGYNLSVYQISSRSPTDTSGTLLC
uniref:Uncharacterized protein n=1 Tax=Meloidogyne enterolobii TaxID=390850 RepID=A0A6V7UCU3_MELEN|nr:unnamed protein product [Meloidogyne enterolobii]